VSLSDAFSSALDGLGQNIAGIGTGANPLFAPQITQLVGLNVPAVPIISVRDYFLAQMDSWFTAIPMATQWVILIDQYPQGLNTSLIQGLERIDGSKQGFDIDNAKNILTNFALNKVIGCLFAANVTVPNEAFNVESAYVDNNRGFLPGVLGGARNHEAPVLEIGFRETNTSFIDFVVRPWVILGAHFGMVARPGDVNGSRDPKNMKCNMHLFQYTRSRAGVSMIPRKIWNFYNCMPFTVNEESLEYTEEKMTVYNTRWTYSNYTVTNNLYLPIGEIINGFVKNGLPTIGNPSVFKGFSPV
jgi:hypothetical protein